MILSKRLLTSASLILLTAGVLFFAPPIGFSLEVIVLTAATVFEFFTLLKKAGIFVYRLFGTAMGLAIPILVTMEPVQTKSGEVLFLVLGFLFLFVMQFFRKNNAEALTGISLTLFGILYVSWFASFLIRIRYLEEGVLWVAYLLAVTKSSDIGAYLVGTSLGRHNFVPHISPKKSIEGVLGGFLFSVAVSVGFRRFLPIDFSVPHVLILGFLISLIGQIGDLAESVMKRFCGVKDSGSSLPGMGGFLDAFDSILFTAPIFYFHLKIYL